MSEDIQAATGDDEGDATADAATDDPAILRTRMEVLQEENQRLREEYTRARQSQYRRTALALVGVGVLALLGGLLYADTRTILFALGGTGAYLGLLVLYLTPEAFIAASVGERIYGTLATNEQRITTDLGLSDKRVYVYVAEGAGDESVKLYVPQSEEGSLPASSQLTEPFVVTDDARGLSLQPTGEQLVTQLEEGLIDELATDPERLLTTLTEALVEQFELVDDTDYELDSESSATEGQATIRVNGSVYGGVDRFDHPVVSTVAVGIARAFEVHVETDVTRPDDGEADSLITVSWG